MQRAGTAHANGTTSGNGAGGDKSVLESKAEERQRLMDEKKHRLVEQVNQLRKSKRVMQENPIEDPYAAYVDGCRSRFFSLYTL